MLLMGRGLRASSDVFFGGWMEVQNEVGRMGGRDLLRKPTRDENESVSTKRCSGGTRSVASFADSRQV